MDNVEILKSNQLNFFKYMNEKYPVCFNSNIFLRDIQYAIQHYFKQKEIQLDFKKTNKYASEFIGFLENNNDLLKIDANSWKVNFNIHSTKETV